MAKHKNPRQSRFKNEEERQLAKKIASDKYRQTDKYVYTYKNNHLKRTYGITLDDYNAIEETMYLMSTPNNLKNLLQSIEEVKQGKVIEMDIE